MADQSRTIRIPVHLVEALNKVTRVQRQLAQEYNREPTIDEIATASGLPKKKINTVLSASTQPISLATTIGDDSSTEIGNLVEDKSGIVPSEVAEKDMTKEEKDRMALLYEMMKNPYYSYVPSEFKFTPYETGGEVSGPGGPKDDAINAKLSDGEFVMTAKAVQNMGNGSRMAGAKKKYQLMNSLDPESEKPSEAML